MSYVVHAEPKPSVCELTEKELDRVSGGHTKGATRGSRTTFGGIVVTKKMDSASA